MFWPVISTLMDQASLSHGPIVTHFFTPALGFVQFSDDLAACQSRISCTCSLLLVYMYIHMHAHTLSSPSFGFSLAFLHRLICFLNMSLFTCSAPSWRRHLLRPLCLATVLLNLLRPQQGPTATVWDDHDLHSSHTHAPYC